LYLILELLEAEKLYIIAYIYLIESTVKSFQEINDEKKIDALVESATSFAKNCNVELEKTSSTSTQTKENKRKS